MLSVVLVAPATTTVRRLPTEVGLDEVDGLPRSCVVNLDTPELLPKAILVDRIASLSSARMRQICAALTKAVNC